MVFSQPDAPSFVPPDQKLVTALLPIGQDYTRPENRRLHEDTAVLRLLLNKPSEAVVLDVRLSGEPLTPASVEGELFPSPYADGVPKDHSCYLDYEVPLARLGKGPNPITLQVKTGEEVLVERMEIAVYLRGKAPVPQGPSPRPSKRPD